MVTLSLDKDLLLIDGSYFVFFRYYATLNWFRLRKNTTPTEELMDDPEFVSKYSEMFKKTLIDLVRGHRTDWSNVVFVKDSPREDVWRNEFYKEYKRDREEKRDTFNKDVFRLTYGKVLPELQESFGLQVIGAPKLEADDVIAILKDIFRSNGSWSNIVIITNDNDYVQLFDKNTMIVNLKGIELSKRVPVDPSVYLRYKIIAGDKSDCIPSIMKKLGPKTAEKLCMCEEHLTRFFEKHPEAQKRYQLNSMLVDFNSIPKHLREVIQEQVTVL